MPHKVKHIDVEAMFQRYVALTGDVGAELVRIGVDNNGTYQIHRSRTFIDGLSAPGAHAAYVAIKAFCDGYRYAAGLPADPQPPTWHRDETGQRYGGRRGPTART